jgi:hypothetical protein
MPPLDKRRALLALLVPRRRGVELTEINAATGATAFAGSGFDPDRPQHWRGSDALRYAIAIQQLRDDGRWPEADWARDWVISGGYHVRQSAGATTIHGLRPEMFGRRAPGRPMPIVDGILHDADPR